MNSSKKLTIKIEIDLKKYTGSVLLLLNSLLTNLLGTQIELKFDGDVLDNITVKGKSEMNDAIIKECDVYNADNWVHEYEPGSKMGTESVIPKLKLPTEYVVDITLSPTNDGKTNIEKLSIPLLFSNRTRIYGIQIINPQRPRSIVLKFKDPDRTFWTYNPKEEVPLQYTISDTLAVIKQRIKEIKEIDLKQPEVDATQVVPTDGDPTLPEQDSQILSNPNI
jgi:hypothetical protein